MIQFDQYFSNGLKPPTRYYIYIYTPYTDPMRERMRYTHEFLSRWSDLSFIKEDILRIVLEITRSCHLLKRYHVYSLPCNTSGSIVRTIYRWLVAPQKDVGSVRESRIQIALSSRFRKDECREFASILDSIYWAKQRWFPSRFWTNKTSKWGFKYFTTQGRSFHYFLVFLFASWFLVSERVLSYKRR